VTAGEDRPTGPPDVEAEGPRDTAVPPPTERPGRGFDDDTYEQAGSASSGGAPSEGSSSEDATSAGSSEGGAGAGTDQAASDELSLAQTALAERTLDLQRLQAEYLNYKRRVERDRELVKQNATYGVLSSLLPVLDDIDRAREHGELEGGFKAVAESLERAVAGLGLSKFGAKGDAFDPNQHEALMHGHSPDVSTTTVDVVARAGYRIGERVVRAAKVTVLDPEQ
jgi:molecular chaperone GrpE